MDKINYGSEHSENIRQGNLSEECGAKKYEPHPQSTYIHTQKQTTPSKSKLDHRLHDRIKNICIFVRRKKGRKEEAQDITHTRSLLLVYIDWKCAKVWLLQPWKACQKDIKRV